MWWWVLPVVVVGAKLIYDAVSEEERAARESFEANIDKVELSLKEHKKNITMHLKQAQTSRDFHFLVNLHHSSSLVANQAYQLLDDERQSLSGINKMLKQSKQARTTYQLKLKQAQSLKNKAQITEIIDSLNIINCMRNDLFADREKIENKKQDILSEVQKFNHQTRKLKEHIRDNCGNRGVEWYNKLEARVRAKRIQENKR